MTNGVPTVPLVDVTVTGSAVLGFTQWVAAGTIALSTTQVDLGTTSMTGSFRLTNTGGTAVQPHVVKSVGRSDVTVAPGARVIEPAISKDLRAMAAHWEDHGFGYWLDDIADHEGADGVQEDLDHAQGHGLGLVPGRGVERLLQGQGGRGGRCVSGGERLSRTGRQLRPLRPLQGDDRGLVLLVLPDLPEAGEALLRESAALQHQPPVAAAVARVGLGAGRIR